jgi:hypothetical protein
MPAAIDHFQGSRPDDNHKNHRHNEHHHGRGVWESIVTTDRTLDASMRAARVDA